MSSEQVIAGLAGACAEWEAEAKVRPCGNAGRRALLRCAATVREYLKIADRLSTPAGDDEVSRWIAALTRAAEQNDTDLLPDGMRAIAELLGQLQARNAEQAAELADARTDRNEWLQRAAQNGDRLTALLDGIEGLPSGIVKEVGGSLVMIGELSEPYRASAGRVYIISAEKLDALRESSVPAPNPEGSGAG